MLDATRLRVLVAVATYGSVTGAAQALNYAQPSISHHMARLEAETGTKLIERSGRGIRLTEAGQLLADRAAEILGRLDAAEAELAAHVGQRRSRARLASYAAALGSYVPAAAAALRGDPSCPSLELVEADPDNAERMLRSGLVDVAVTFEYLMAEPSPGSVSAYVGTDLRFRVLVDEPVYLVTAESAIGPVPTLAELAGQGWITGRGRARLFLDAYCAQAGFAPKIAVTTDDYIAAQSLVAAGCGAAMLPASAMRPEVPGVVMTELPDARHRVLAVTFGAPPEAPACARLIAALTEACDVIS